MDREVSCLETFQSRTFGSRPLEPTLLVHSSWSCEALLPRFIGSSTTSISEIDLDLDHEITCTAIAAGWVPTHCKGSRSIWFHSE